MPVDFNKVDAALFALERYLNEIVHENGRYLDHAEYFHELLRHLRVTIAQNSQPPRDEKGLGTTIIREPLKNPRRPNDKGKMSNETRLKLSRKLKAYWRNRRKKGKSK